jgi:hypothetical protein
VHVPARLTVALLALVAGAFTALTALGDSSAATPAPARLTAGHRVSPHVMGLHHRRHGARQQSLNWSGYIRTGHGFTGTSASWTVPTLTSTHDGYSSTWVGIDGATSSDRYLIQTGTEADVSGGRRSYRAWWEVITPTDVAPETLFDDLVIHPGDRVSASVSRLASGRWVMRLRNATTRHSASHTTAFGGPGATAEWIQEDTDVNGYISTAPDWHEVTFTSVRLNRANPKLQPAEAVDLVDSHGTREAVTGAPTRSGDGFTVTWLAPGTRTYAG